MKKTLLLWCFVLVSLTQLIAQETQSLKEKVLKHIKSQYGNGIIICHFTQDKSKQTFEIKVLRKDIPFFINGSYETYNGEPLIQHITVTD